MHRYALSNTIGQGNYGKAILATRKEDGEQVNSVLLIWVFAWVFLQVCLAPVQQVVIKQILLSEIDDKAREVRKNTIDSRALSVPPLMHL